MNKPKLVINNRSYGVVFHVYNYNRISRNLRSIGYKLNLDEKLMYLLFDIDKAPEKLKELSDLGVSGVFMDMALSNLESNNGKFNEKFTQFISAGCC